MQELQLFQAVLKLFDRMGLTCLLQAVRCSCCRSSAAANEYSACVAVTSEAGCQDG